MGRHSNIASLALNQQTQVDQCIRAHRYRNLDFIMEEVETLGISGFSRSALHRYLLKLEKDDALHADPEQSTIVTIIERVTGEIRVVKTSASGFAIAALIAKNTKAVTVS